MWGANKRDSSMDTELQRVIFDCMTPSMGRKDLYKKLHKDIESEGVIIIL
jgi:hypothetical protein